MTNTITSKTAIDALAADDYIGVDDTSASATTKKCTPAQILTYVLAGTGTASGITSGAVSLTPSPSSDVSTSGTTMILTAGENVAFGDVVYIKSDGKMWKADANAAGLFPANYMAAATILANATGVFLKQGFARNDAWNWTVGGKIYLSTTAGGMTQTAPSATDDCIQVLGTATHADRIDFTPSTNYYTHV